MSFEQFDSHQKGSAPRRLLNYLIAIQHNETAMKAVSVGVVAAFVITVLLLRNHLPDIRTVGYVGVLVLSFVGSASILIPVPGIAAVCAGPSIVGLSPVIVALVASVGEAFGELSGYLIGFSGRGFADKNRFYPRIERWMQDRGGLALFLASSVPNPFFDLIGIAGGTLKYPVWRFLLAVWAGKMVKSLLIAYTCFFGFEWATRFFGFD